MNTILGWLSQNALTVAVLIPVVWLLCWRLRLQPASQYLLWLLLLAKLLLPPLVEWPLPALPVARMGFVNQPEKEEAPSMGSVAVKDLGSVEQGMGAIAMYPRLEEGATGNVMAHQFDPAVETGGVGSVASELGPDEMSGAAVVGGGEIHREADASRSPGEIGVMVIATAWLVGSVIAFLWFVARLWTTRRLLLRSLAAPPKLTALVTQVAKREGVRRVRVRITPEIDAPCVVSLGRPVLLWPEKLVQSATTAHRAVLVHELAHIARRDHWVLWLEALGGLVWWWNPCFWHIRRQLHDSRELACDALALMHGGSERSQYAKLLLELTTGQSFTFRPTPVCGVGARSKRSLERRLQMLFDERTSGRPGWLGWLAAVAVAALIVPAWSVGQDSGSAESKPAEEKKAEAGISFGIEGASGRVSVPSNETGGSVAQESGAQIQFQDEGKKTENSLVSKWAEDKAPAKPPVEGAITAVQDEYVELSIGSKDGIHVGQELTVVIPKTKTAKATVVVVKVRDAEALGLVARRYRKDPIETKDPVIALGEGISAAAIRFMRGGLAKGVGVNSDAGVTGTIAGDGSGGTIGIDLGSAGTRSVRGTTGSGNVVAGESASAGSTRTINSSSRSTTGTGGMSGSSRSTGFKAGPGKRVMPLVGPATVDVETPDGTFSIWMPETDNGSSSRPWLLRLEKDGKVHTYNLSEITSKPTPDKSKEAQEAAIEKGLNYLRQSQPSAATPAASSELLKLDLELAELNVEQKQADMNRVRKLAEQKAISIEEVQQAEFALRRAQIELKKCKAILDQASTLRQR